VIRLAHIGFVGGIVMMGIAAVAQAQTDYRNTDPGRPVRISDATPTERRALEISLTSARLEKLTLGRYRLQLEPRIAYGLFPRTEVSLRAPVFFYERALSPRAGIGGIGLGSEHQLMIETLGFPALAVAGEVFVPTGPAAVRTSYIGKAIVTRTVSAFRVHVNGSLGTFSFREPAATEIVLPPLHGPCTVIPETHGIRPMARCISTRAGHMSAELTRAEGPVRTRTQWMAGLAIDRSFPLSSLLVIADVYRQKYEGIGRPADWTGEIGARRQITRALVVDGAIGRLFTGESRAWFASFGTTLSRAGRL